MSQNNWYHIENEASVSSPCLLVYPDRIEKNIQAMIRMVGNAARLRPHIKTHKMTEIIDLQMQYGIQKFKCATIAEGELLGISKAADVLLAMQPVGPNVRRLFDLVKQFPRTHFSTLADNPSSIWEIGEEAKLLNRSISVYLDLNVGMNRTGVEPSEKAFQIFKMINDHEFLEPAGLHVYDGHIRHSDPEVRKKHCDSAFELVLQLKTQIENAGIPVKEIVAGGSPTFPIHAKREEVIASPGTTLLWDARYGSSFPDMQFLPAAVLLTRVISKPARNILCLDLGHKAVAPEMDFPRVLLLEMEAFKQIGQSEEHLVLSSPDDRDLPIGTVCYAIPMHVCPTVAKYPKAHTVIDGKITGEWKVAARDHQITI